MEEDWITAQVQHHGKANWKDLTTKQRKESLLNLHKVDGENVSESITEFTAGHMTNQKCKNESCDSIVNRIETHYSLNTSTLYYFFGHVTCTKTLN